MSGRSDRHGDARVSLPRVFWASVKSAGIVHKADKDGISNDGIPVASQVPTGNLRGDRGRSAAMTVQYIEHCRLPVRYATNA